MTVKRTCASARPAAVKTAAHRLTVFSSSSSSLPIFVLSVAVVAAAAASCAQAASSASLYHNQFAVLIPHGTPAADRLAARHGFINLGQIGALENYFLFEQDRLRGKRSTARPDPDSAKMLTDEPEIEWFEQQEERKRVKRDGTLHYYGRQRGAEFEKVSIGFGVGLAAAAG
jgi:hypothetical protein